jgi:CBS domain-containing protein
MNELTVRDLMVPRNQYASIGPDNTLYEAALALQEAQRLEQSLDPGRHRDRAILVVDEFGKVTGKLSMLNVLGGLLPRYARVGGHAVSARAAARLGSARALIESQERDAGRWKKPLENLIEKASDVRVHELIRPFGEGELVDEDESLDSAIHKMVNGRYQSLLVTRDGEIVGILRLTDVYEEISERLRANGASGEQGGPGEG